MNLYRALLMLYPLAFYERHRDEMLCDFADLRAQYRGRRFSFLLRIASDYLTSLLQEYLHMLFDRGLRRVFVLQAVLLTTLVSALALMTYVVGQQVMRHEANDPQVQLASDAASAIAGGATPQSVLPPQSIDLARSLSPFVIVYDAAGRPLASSATLHGATPRPPIGVLNHSRTTPGYAVTWRPEPGLRIASVLYPYPSGYVLAGRSLRTTETRTATLFQLVAFCWAVLMFVLFAGTLALLRNCPAPAKA